MAGAPDLPDLPETNDPFEFLGVSLPIDSRDLKRAYVRMIKVYRPERAPQEFQQIQRAYEVATQLLEAGVTGYVEADENDIEDSLGHDDGASAGVSVAEPTASAWGRVNDPDQASGREVGSQAEDHQPKGSWQTVVLELEDPFAARRETVAELITGLLMGVPVAQALLDHPDSWQWSDFTQLETADWSVIRLQTPADAAINLLWMRLEGLLLAGRVEQALSEVEAPELARDALAYGALEAVVTYVSAVGFWQHPQHAARVVAPYVDARPEGEMLEAMHRLNAHVWSFEIAWRHVAQTAPPPEPLVKYLSLAPVVGQLRRSELASGIATEIWQPGEDPQVATERRAAYIATVKAVDEVSEDLAQHVLSLTDVQPRTPPEPESLRQILGDTERALRRPNGWLYVVSDWQWALAMIAIVGTFFLVELYGLVVLVLLSALYIYRWHRRRRHRFFEARVRGPVLKAIHRTGMDAEDLSAHIKKNRWRFLMVGEFWRDTAEDRMLQILGSLVLTRRP